MVLNNESSFSETSHPEVAHRYAKFQNNLFGITGSAIYPLLEYHLQIYCDFQSHIKSRPNHTIDCHSIGDCSISLVENFPLLNRIIFLRFLLFNFCIKLAVRSGKWKSLVEGMATAKMALWCGVVC